LNRIEAINSFINEDDLVVDVGCDQAKLGLLLASRNIASIASDISVNVINKAKETINNPLIDLRVSDGLLNIKEGESDTLVLSGMGTYTMLDILNKTNLRFKKIITISNNNHDMLRSEMSKLNYKVDSELIIKENNKYYNLINFVEGTCEYTKKDLLLGLNHKDIEKYKEYLSYLLKKYNKIKETSKDKNNKINEVINLINQIL